MAQISFQDAGGRLYGEMQKCIIYIQNHPDQDITMEDLAGRMAYAPIQLSYLFDLFFEKSLEEWDIEKIRAYQGKGKIIGVMPRFLLKIEKLYDHLDEEYMVDTMSQRKQKMIDLAQGFIALPGGPGTLEEITEIISLVRLDQLPYPCVLYNLDGYYDTLKQQLDVMIKEGFLDAEGIKNVHFVTSLE